MRCGSKLIFTDGYLVVSIPIIKIYLSLLTCHFCHTLYIYIWVCLWTYNSAPLFWPVMHMPVPYCCNYWDFAIWLLVKQSDGHYRPSLAFSFRISTAVISSVLYEFITTLSSLKNIFIDTSLEIYEMCRLF